MRRAFQDAVWIVGLCALAGCSGGNGDSPPPPLQSSSKITIAPAGPLNLAAGGEGVQLSATLTLPSGAVDKTAVFTWKSGDNAIVSVTSQGFVTGLKVGVASVTAVSGTTAGGITIGVVGTAMGAKTLTLSGNADYEDRTFGPNGFTGALNATPIRQAVVEAVAIDGFQVIGATTSDANGDFALTVDNSTRRGGVYLRVVSKTDTAQKTKIHIKDNAVDQNFLSFASKSMDDSLSDPFSATQNILATAASKIGGAFNILAVLVDASEFVQAVGSCPSSPYPDCVPPLVTVYWEPGSAEGTFYDTTADAITLLGGGGFGGDADEYDDGVIIHEYGHFIAVKFLRDDSPGGFHALTDNAQDIRLSWSEGWANFFAVAVQNSPVYVDTASGGAQLSVNMETYSSPSTPSLPSLAVYTTSEIAVAGVLWDLFDPVGTTPGESDPVALNFSEIFKTFLSFPPAKPTTLETFWTQFSVGSTTAPLNADFQTVLKGKKIELFTDTTEGLETPLFVNGATQPHTLYGRGTDPVGDLDPIPFTAVSGMTYTVKTLNLSNGADTFLTIKDPSGFAAASNDNSSGLNHASCSLPCPENNGSNLASSVTFTAQTSGTFKAEVSRSPSAPPSAGLFGSYDIELTGP